MRKGNGRLIEIPEGDGDPLNQRIAAHLRGLILDGSIDPGARLPAQRLLARDLRVSRNTVLSALQQLTSEGLLEARVGSGTYVVDTPTPYRRAQQPPTLGVASSAMLPLDLGEPALDLFPMKTWNRVLGQRWRRMPQAALREAHPFGWPGLRAVIAQRLAAQRGVRTSAQQILIVPSAQAGVELTAKALAAAGETALIEDPGYWRARDGLKNAGLKITPVSVDIDGFDIAAAPAPARIAYVTPCAQFPTGAAMSPERRNKLLSWATTNDAWIIEDEFEPDFWFDKRPRAPLAREDKAGRVVYVGTLSSIFFPGVRLAYLSVPEAVLDRFHRLASSVERSANIPQQVVVQDFFEQGHVATHLRASRHIYAERRDVLLTALRTRLGGECRVTTPMFGLSVQAWLTTGAHDLDIKARVIKQGVEISAMSGHALLPCRPGFFLGFAPYTPDQIRRAVDKIAQAFEHGAAI